jgi:regulatory protein
MAKSLADPSLARAEAMKWIARRPLTRAELIERLTGRGTSESDATQLAADLTRLGMINDALLASDSVRRELRRAPAGDALLRAKLESRGIDETKAERAVREQAGGDELGRAISLLRKEVTKRTGRVKDAPAERRRLAGLLGRRGFEAEVCEEALRKVVGEIEET